MSNVNIYGSVTAVNISNNGSQKEVPIPFIPTTKSLFPYSNEQFLQKSLLKIDEWFPDWLLEKTKKENELAKKAFESVVNAIHEKDFYYTLSTGFVLIINNEKFVEEENRDGSEVDVQALSSFFKGTLGWCVKSCNNLKREDIINIVYSLSQVKCFPFSALFIVILSHGSESGILGIDSPEEIKINSLLENFKADNAPAFDKKPKVFIVQACRGERDDIRKDGIKDSKRIYYNESTIPMLSDFVVAYPCAAGYTALRSTIKGSWFIQELVKSLSIFYDKEDFLSILNRVNFKVANVTLPQGLKEQPCFEVGLRTRCFFQEYFRKLHNILEYYSSLNSDTKNLLIKGNF
ncbi:caspase-3-like [Hydra vulgaris]|uniref:Caspase-3-like n=1 Tax=Hydra vulgaris TaxID=6087 RepID=A0ABM4C6B6_HYDVU